MNDFDPVEVLYRHFSNQPYKITTSWVVPSKFVATQNFKKLEFKKDQLPRQVANTKS